MGARPPHRSGPPAGSAGTARRAPAGSGTFRPYTLQAPIGAETYRSEAHGDSATLVARWEASYLGSPVRQSATLAWDATGAPVGLVARGGTSTMTSVDLAVERRPGVRGGAEGRVDGAAVAGGDR